MKTIIRITTLFILAITVSLGKAQTITVCAGNNAVITAQNSLGLSSPNFSMNPGGISSANPAFTVSPASTFVYTLYVTGTNSNSAVVTTSNLVTVQVANYPVTSVMPVNQSINCGPGVMVTATCVCIAPTSNVTHNWYSPASPSYPLSSGGQVSTYPLSGFNGSLTTYTCVVVDNTSGCSTSKTVQVISTAGNYPTFGVISAASFTLGCATRSVADINIVNANTAAPGGGVVSFTLLPPSFAGTGYTTSPLVPSYTLNIPGTYTVVVRDNGNQCETRIPISVLQNTFGPSIFVSVATQTLSCSVPSVILRGHSSLPNVSYTWKKSTIPPLTADSLLPVSTTTAGASVNSATVIDNYTLTVVDNSPMGNWCPTGTVVTLYQNTRPPYANIAMSYSALTCAIYTVNLTNNSTTGVLPNTFFGTGNLNAILWLGPTPQSSATYTSTYLGSTPGLYTMTVMDMNNGCTSSTTRMLYSNGPQAAFAYNIASGQATFTDTSTGTTTNTTYFWDFGDGIMSTSQNPMHTYTNGGSHIVKFKISDPQATFCTDSVIQSVNVSGVPCVANSNFAMFPTNTPQVWNVIPAYPWNVIAASWDWGDNSSSNSLYTSHQYSAAAMYNVCLSVTVSCVASSSTCAPYTVYRVSQAAQIIAINVIKPDLVSGIAPVAVGEQLSWDILPNPNAGDFQLLLNITVGGSVRVVISDLIGRIVHDQSIEPNATTIDLHTNNLPTGLYMVTLESAGFRATKRMIINH